MRLIFYTVMLLLGFSIRVVLGLLLLRRLQPGEPLVDLTGGETLLTTPPVQLGPHQTVRHFAHTLMMS